MAKRVQLIDKGWQEIQKQLNVYKNTEVAVGFLGNADPKVKEYAAYNQFGTKHIPAVNFMEIAFKNFKNEINNAVRVGVVKVYQGSTAKIQSSVVGRISVKAVQRTIVAIKTPPNAPATIKKKGFDNRLFDTGKMVSEVEFELR